MYKQVIVVRKDLKMGKGKLAAQVAHASVGAAREADQSIVASWHMSGAKKVVLKVPDEKAMVYMEKRVRRAGLPCVLVRDAGRTQLEAGTATALGIGPDEEALVDKVTGKLKLL